MILNVNPNRMELLHLRRRHAMARRGHKLLKDKQDELMRLFLEIVERSRKLREETEAGLTRVYTEYRLAAGLLPAGTLDDALLAARITPEGEVGTKRLLNLKIPAFRFRVGEKQAPRGIADRPVAADSFVLAMTRLAPKLLELAGAEKSIEMLADEIEKTRRRVNALEYVLIPNLEETIRYINMKLAEMERSNITRLMKIKAMVGEE